MNRNLVGSIYGRSSIKISYFVMIRLQAWPLQTILVTDWLISKKYSPLKLLSQMKRNLVGSIYGRSSINSSYFVMIRLQACPLQTILVTDWLISKKSSPLKLRSQMNRNLVGSMYGRSSIKISYFVMIRLQACPLQTILVTDWLISKKSSLLKLLSQMNRNLVGNIYGRSSINISYFVMIHLQAWPLQTILVTDWLISKKIFSSETA